MPIVLLIVAMPVAPAVTDTDSIVVVVVPVVAIVVDTTWHASVVVVVVDCTVIEFVVMLAGWMMTMMIGQ